MTTAVTRYTAGTVGAPTRVDGSASTDTVQWGDPVLTWAVLHGIPGLPDTTEPALIEGVVKLPGARRGPGGVSQLRVGWKAWQDRVLVVAVARPLEARQDGRFAPAGPWEVRDATTRTATGPASIRRGVIDPGPAIDDSTSPATTSGPGVSADHVTGADVEPFLPPPVRASVRAAVPTPVVWVGQLVRADLGRDRVEQELTTLRLGTDAAVAIKATRNGPERRLATQPWDVLQVTLPLAPTGLLIGR